MKNLHGRVAAITGAGSGIGKALALQLAAEGCELAISDINEQAVNETAELARSHGAEVLVQRLDVADREAVYAWAEAVENHFGKVNMIFNNAGVALGTSVENMEYDDIEWLMGINFWGVVYGTKAFLPMLKRAGDGHIINVSSVFGFIGVPTQSAYNAAKFAVRGFTESLRQELELQQNGVSCSCVHPGGIKTNIARAARMGDTQELTGMDAATSSAEFEKMFRTTPEDAAATIIKGVKDNRRRILIGPDAVVIDTMARLLPGGYQRLMVSGQKLLRKRAQR